MQIQVPIMHQAEITHYCYFDSPIGNLLLAGNLKALGLIAFPNQIGAHEIQKTWIHSISPFRSVINQLSAYFEGSLKEFSLECLLTGTEFQTNVLKELTKIPYGETCSYADIAESIGHPKAYRAVGSANGKNQLPIIYPCHRVISSNGDIGGFSGGLGIKKALLELESKFTANNVA